MKKNTDAATATAEKKGGNTNERNGYFDLVRECLESELSKGETTPLDDRDMARMSHSRRYLAHYEIEQQDGTVTRSFKDAADGSVVNLTRITINLDDYYSSDVDFDYFYENETYVKHNGKWYGL